MLRGRARSPGTALLYYLAAMKSIWSRDELPGDPTDKQSRYLEAAINGVVIGCIYLPNGNPQPGPKFDYKLAWFERLIRHARALKKLKAPVALVGDYNVVPTDFDILSCNVQAPRTTFCSPENSGR